VVYPAYEDRWLPQLYKQMAVVVDQAGQNHGIRYKLRWSGVSTPPARTEIRLAELQHNDSALIGLENYVPAPASLTVQRATALNQFPDETVAAWEPLLGVQDLLSLQQSATSDFWADTSTGILWIRIVAKASSPGAALVLHTDRLGQVIEVNYR